MLEGVSFRKAVRQVRGAARKWGVTPRGVPVATTDTTVKAVTFEDTAALVGLVLAALGLFLEQITGDPLWDGVAAIPIGLLLLVVAYVARAGQRLAARSGRRPRRASRQQLTAEIAALDHVVDVPFLLTSVIGPGQLLVAAKVDFDDDATAGDIERIVRRGRAAAGRPARGRALRLPRPDRRRRAAPGPRPTGPTGPATEPPECLKAQRS